MKQVDLERINRIVISQINAIWTAKVPEGMIEAIVEDLARYDDATLGAAMKEVRRTSRTRPTIAQLVEACEQFKPAPIQKAVKADTPIQRNEALADQVMRSPVGQRAIRLGVAGSVWLHAYRDGKAEFSDADLEAYHRSLLRAAEELNRVPPGALRDSLEGVYNAMQRQEHELAGRYAA